VKHDERAIASVARSHFATSVSVSLCGVPPDAGIFHKCHDPSTSLRLNVISPVGENAGPHMNGECVASVRGARAEAVKVEEFRQRELMKAIVPSAATVGPASAPAPR
jgi:hypothetical protein